MRNPLKSLSYIFAITCILAGTFVIVEWVYNLAFLQNIKSQYFMMRISTAICMIILATALLISNTKKHLSYSVKSAIIIAVLSIAVIVIWETCFTSDFSTFLLRFKDANPHKTFFWPPMPLITAIDIVLCAIAVSIQTIRPSAFKTIQTILLVVFLTGLLALTAHLYNTRNYFGLSYYVKMPMLTSISFICFSLAQLCLQRHKGIVSFFTSRTIGGVVARRLIPMVIILPLIFGWLKIKGQEKGLYEYTFGTALFAISVVAVLIIVILWNVKRMIEAEWQRLEMESSLKQSDESLRIIFNQAPHAMIVMNDAGLITKWNQRAEEIFEWKGDEVLGRPMHELIIPHRYRPMHLKGIETFLKTGHGPVLNKTLELSALRKSGFEFPIELRISFTKQDNSYIFIAFVNDITDRKQIASDLNRKTEDLELANKELEQFAYVASHDLQEPLRTISNFVGLLEKKYKDNIDDSANEYIRFIVKATSKMRNLIKDLLDLSRIGRDVVFTDIDCNDVMKEVLSEMEASVLESNAKIRFAPLPIIQGNQLEIKLLFQNLISNGIKFRKDKVNVEIEVKAEEKVNEFLFSITDNGIGLEPQYKDKIFIIFQRLHTSEEYPGTGIGLATCKKIVLRHGGNIWVESEPGHGSTFYFTIQKQGQHIIL